MAFSESALVGAFSFVVQLLYFNYFRFAHESWRLWLTVAFFPITFLPFYVLVALLIAEDNASSGPVISALKSLVYNVAVGAPLLFNYVKDRCVMVKRELRDRLAAHSLYIVHAARFLADQLDRAFANIMDDDDDDDTEEHDRSDAVPAPHDSCADEYYNDLVNDCESEFPTEDEADYAAQSHKKDESNVETELQVEEKEDSSEERSVGERDHEEQDGTGPTNGIGEEDVMSNDCGEESGYKERYEDWSIEGADSTEEDDEGWIIVNLD